MKIHKPHWLNYHFGTCTMYWYTWCLLFATKFLLHKSHWTRILNLHVQLTNSTFRVKSWIQKDKWTTYRIKQWMKRINGRIFSLMSTIHLGLSTRWTVCIISVSPWTNTIVSHDQFKPIRMKTFSSELEVLIVSLHGWKVSLQTNWTLKKFRGGNYSV